MTIRSKIFVGYLYEIFCHSFRNQRNMWKNSWKYRPRIATCYAIRLKEVNPAKETQVESISKEKELFTRRCLTVKPIIKNILMSKSIPRGVSSSLRCLKDSLHVAKFRKKICISIWGLKNTVFLPLICFRKVIDTYPYFLIS